MKKIISLLLCVLFCCPVYADGIFNGSGSSGSGTVTSIATGCQATGGTITTTGTISTQTVINDLSGSNPAITTGYCGQLENLDNATAQIPTIAVAGASGFPQSWYTDLCNINTGAQTLTPASGTIGGASTYVIAAGSKAKPNCIRIVSDAANTNYVVETTTSVALANITGLGTGVATALGDNVGSAGAFVVNGGALGTPSSGTLTNATGLPISTGVNGLGTNVATLLGGNASGTGGPAGTTSPTFVTPTLGAASATTVAIGAGSAITSSGAGGALGSNAFTSTAYAPLASPTFSGTVTFPDSSTLTSSGLTSLAALGVNTTIGNSAKVSINAGNVNNGSPGLYVTGSGTDTAISFANTNTNGRTWQFISSGGISGLGAGTFTFYDLTLGGSVGPFKIVGGALNAGYISIGYTTASTSTSTGSITTGGGLGVQGASFLNTLNVTGMAQTSAAQSGTVCYTSSTGLLTYDASLGCLTSLEETKSIKGPITGALDEVLAMRPFWFTPIDRPKGSDLAEQPGFGAHQIESIDPRLVGYDAEGNLRGVRYMEMTAVLAAAIKEQQAEIEKLKAENTIGFWALVASKFGWH